MRYYLYSALGLSLALYMALFQPFAPKRNAAFTVPKNPFPASEHEITNVNQYHFLPHVGRSSHSSSVARLANGNLIAAWFTGAREGAKDVSIVTSYFKNGGWQKPSVAVDHDSLSGATFSYIKRIGNPVLWYNSKNAQLYLFVVSTSLGGWSTSNINYAVSSDQGASWSRLKRLYLSPFFNMSSLVRTPPIADKGGFAVPAYHEVFRKYGILMWFNNQGSYRGYSRISTYNQMLQPAVLKVREGSWVALSRSALRKGDNSYKIGYADSKDGLVWKAQRWLDIKNRDSSLALAQMRNGQIVMAYNDPSYTKRNGGRSALLLATSKDGIDFTPRWRVEYHEGQEFSYPTIITHNGVIDLTYTYHRKDIRHFRISESELMQAPPLAKPQ